MTREQREGHKHGETDHTSFRGFRVFRGENSKGHYGFLVGLPLLRPLNLPLWRGGEISPGTLLQTALELQETIGDTLF